jgi:hypothetical protein
MEKIKQFLNGYGYGNGNGDGNGDGHGNGDGNGDGYGYGNGYGYGDGNGNGYGNGNGNGYGNGNGNGYSDGKGDGYGNGDGNGNGNGDGDGDGYGYGDGDGDGYGNGYGDGFKLHNYFGEDVYYVDGIPCTFISVVGECAKVNVIDIASFSTSEKYIYKFNGVFAHGNSLEIAKSDAERKYYSALKVDESVHIFKETFLPKTEYPNEQFYNWHTILTGSCDSGKTMWIRQNRIDITGSMTRETFLELTKNAYGGDVIRKIME